MANPLDRRKGETNRAHRGLMDMFRLGPGATLGDLASRYQQALDGTEIPPTKSYQTLKNWSKRHEWQARLAEAFTQQEADRAEEEKAIWAERRAAVLQADYDMAQKLREVVDSTLDQLQNFVRTERRIIPAKDGLPEREIITMGVKESTLLRALDLVSKLQRQSTGLGDIHTIQGTGEDGIIEVGLTGNITGEDF